MRPFAILLAALGVMLAGTGLPAFAQDESQPDTKIKPAIGGAEPGKDKIKPAGQPLGDPQPAVRDNEPLPAPSGIRGRVGQYVPAYQTPQGQFVDPYSGYAYGTNAYSSGYGGYAGSWGCGQPGFRPVSNYGTGYAGQFNREDQARVDYWQANPPRMRVGAYDSRTLQRFGLAADPTDRVDSVNTPRMRLTPNNYPSGTIRPAAFR